VILAQVEWNFDVSALVRLEHGTVVIQANLKQNLMVSSGALQELLVVI
jgi:hypothetical protein